MSREIVRHMKRAVRNGSKDMATVGEVLAKDAALYLLERSIRFGHGRLSVIRLNMAVHAGATIIAEQWNYCRNVAKSSDDTGLRRLYLQAKLNANHLISSDEDFFLDHR